jgi:aminoglycoside phosphotransferase (APT) family kinase protein
MSVDDFLNEEKACGKPTNCGLYLTTLLDKVADIETEASRLRNGMPCHMDLKHFNKGGFNIVFKIIFEDDQIWVCRIQFPDVLHSNDKDRASQEESQLKALYSQLGSMRYVKRHTKIPVPEIYGYDFLNDNVAGAPYMFMELVQGMSVKKWVEENTLTKEKATEFYTQLAEIMWEFYQIRFDKIGELEFDDEGHASVGGFYDSRTSSAYGPFSSAHEFFIQRQQKLWEFRVLGECRNVPVIEPGYTQWDEIPQEARKLFIAWIYRRISAYAETEHQTALSTAFPAETVYTSHLPEFVLFHADLSINNVLVDDDFRITAIIDWDWTASLPKASFDPLPFDMGYETSAQFPGNVRDHEMFDHKALYYSIWKKLEEEEDPEGRLGASLIPARVGEDSIATTLNRAAWSYNIERMSGAMLEKLCLYEGREVGWEELIENFRSDWIETRRSLPSWLQSLINRFWRRRRSS